MKIRVLWLALLLALLTALAVRPVLWAAPGQNVERQGGTVPTRTPAPGPTSPPTDSPVLPTNPPPATQPAPTSIVPTVTPTAPPTSTPTAAATAVPISSTATPQELPTTGPAGEATVTPAAVATLSPTIVGVSPGVTETPVLSTALPTLSASPSISSPRNPTLLIHQLDGIYHFFKGSRFGQPH